MPVEGDVPENGENYPDGETVEKEKEDEMMTELTLDELKEAFRY